MNAGKWLLMTLLLAAPAAHGADECMDGVAAGHACSHVDLLGRLTVAELGGASNERVNDIWGWTDGNGEEYAIVGMYDGTAFVRLGADGTPQFLGRLAGSDGKSDVAKTSEFVASKSCMHDDECEGEGEQASAWRDVKVYGNYAFIVSEATGFGMQVFDLTRLRNAMGVTDWGTEDAHYAGVGHSHNIFINEHPDSQRAYIVGSGSRAAGEAGLHVVDVSDPLKPQFLANINQDGYTHDVQCVMYTGPDTEFSASDEICFASNEDTVTIWQVNDPANAEQLARFGYAGASYVHQGWLSEDQAYFFFNDELDEQNSGSRTKLRVLDVSDLRNPKLAAEYLSPSLAIDHNNYAHGRWLLQSNYTSGLRILDVLEPEHPVQAAYFDTVPGSDAALFEGNWSNYRFAASGRVVLSDIHGGLFVVAPTTDTTGTTAQLAVAVTASESSVTVGTDVKASVSISNGNARDATGVLLTAHLPNGASFSRFQAPSEDWQCGSVPARVVECRKAMFAAGASGEFELTFSRSSAGTADVVVMAYALQADPAPADNLAETSVAFIKAAPAGGGGGGGGSLLWLLAVLPVMRGRMIRT